MMIPEFRHLLSVIHQHDPLSFLRSIVEAVVGAWQSVDVEASVEDDGDLPEDAVTMSLFREIKALPAFRDLPFRISVQHTTFNAFGGADVVRYDLSFEPYDAHQADGKFAVLECKVLRDWSGGTCRSYNSEYVDGEGQGMTAFTTGRYGVPLRWAGMIGYVFCDCGENPLLSLGKLILRRGEELLMPSGVRMRPHEGFSFPVHVTEHQIGGQTVEMLHVPLTKHRAQPKSVPRSKGRKAKAATPRETCS